MAPPDATGSGDRRPAARVVARHPTINALYICYFGLREPLVQTQVLPYLQELAEAGIKPTLLTFEPKNAARSSSEREQWRECLRRQGIRWIWLRYHKFPSLPATAYDILLGNLVSCFLALKHRIGVIHARGHVPATMATLPRLLRRTKLIFDIRGFMPEEYVDAGVWPAGGALYRITKVIERRLLASADAFVVLTERARAILFPGCSTSDCSGRPIEVIPCCVDMHRFGLSTPGQRESIRIKLNINERRVLVYVGALGGWYLTSEMADFIALAHERDPAIFALVLTQSLTESEPFQNRLQQLGLSPVDYKVDKVSPNEVPEFLAAGDIAFCFIKPGYSKLASSPTKIGEFLASGLPVLCNSGIGDVDDLLVRNKVGIVLEEFDRKAYIRALHDIHELTAEVGIRQRCREIARDNFDLRTIGRARYERLYMRLGVSGISGEKPEIAA